MNNDYFSKIPNILLVPTKNKKSIYEHIKDDKLILIFDYLYTNMNREGVSLFSINDIITTYGFKADTHKGRINDKIKGIILKLSELNYITVNFNVNSIKNNELLKCNINDNVVNYDDGFIQLFKSELNTILSCTDIDKLILLKLYCYLKTRIYKRAGDKPISATGGKAEVGYPSYELIYNEIGISESITSKYIEKLKDLKLIVYNNAGVYYHPSNKENKKESANTYALYKKDGSHKDELKEGVKFFKITKEQEGFIFIPKDKEPYKYNNRKLNGELGALTKLKNKGTANEEQLKRIIEIRNIIDSNNK